VNYTVQELIDGLSHYGNKNMETTVVKMRTSRNPDCDRPLLKVTTTGQLTAEIELAEAQKELDELNGKLRKLIQQYKA
jgi:hypothetical protein